MLHRRLTIIRPSHWIAILLTMLLAGAGTVSAQPVLALEPLYDIEPTGAPWPFPNCPVNECPPLVGAWVQRLTILDGGVAAFSAFDFDHGLELWITDGTREGTRRLTDLCPGPCHAEPRLLGAVGRDAVFIATQDGEELGLWAADGTTLRLLAAGVVQAGAVSPEAIDGWLYFSQGRQVWRTNGVIAELASAFPEGGFHLPRQIFGIGAQAFVWRFGLFGESSELWQVGSASQRVLRLCGPGFDQPPIAILHDAAYLGSECVEGLPDLGPGLFCIGGDPGDVERVATFPGGRPFSLLAAAGALYFLEPVENAGTPGLRIWASDGTAAGTVPVSRPVPERFLTLLARLGRYLLISGGGGVRAFDLGSGAMAELPLSDSATAWLPPSGTYALLGNLEGWWVTRGTPAETRQIFSHAEPPQVRSGAVFLGHRAVFGGSDGVDGADLWAFVGEPSALEVPALGRTGLLLLGLLVAAAALRLMSR